tara:strand:- start:150 stop:416 length:267 start_codon:yes stop_codon:yes gene_type:complete
MLKKVREVQKNSNNQDLFVPSGKYLSVNCLKESNNFESFYLVITNRRINNLLAKFKRKKYTPLAISAVLYTKLDLPISKTLSIIMSRR